MQKELLEFKRLSGQAALFEAKDLEEIDLSDTQVDPEDQIDPDDQKKRDDAEAKLRQVVDGDGKVQFDGKVYKKTGKAKK